MVFNQNNHDEDYGVKHVLLSPRDKSGIFPLRKTGKANYDDYWNKKVVKGITEHFPYFETVAFINKKGEMDTKQVRDFSMPAFAGYEEYIKIEPYCYNCHKLLGEAEKARIDYKVKGEKLKNGKFKVSKIYKQIEISNRIGLCMGECTF